MFDQFVYPSYESPLLEAYSHRFESVYVILHPFIRVPEGLAWNATRAYPTDEHIATHASKQSWAEVAAQTGLANCARLNQALLTSIGSLSDFLSDHPGRDRLQAFLQQNPIWMPTEGRFEPLIHPDFLAAFDHLAGLTELVFVPEFPQTDPTVRLTTAELRAGEAPFPLRGTLVAPDASFLFTVDWDSFFTLFYGPRAFIANLARSRNVEGFFAAPATEHAWFNYTMGCATVTVSPEDWSTL